MLFQPLKIRKDLRTNRRQAKCGGGGTSEGKGWGGSNEKEGREGKGKDGRRSEGWVRGGEEVMRGRDGRVRKKMGRESEGKVKGVGRK